MSEGTPSIDTAEVRALAGTATEGPWEANHDGGVPYSCVRSVGDPLADWVAQECYEPADADFIAAARTLVPDLCDALDAAVRRADWWETAAADAAADLRAEVVALRAALRKYGRHRACGMFNFAGERIRDASCTCGFAALVRRETEGENR